eukprot:PhF_6_TR5485/c0_g1_i1/m.7736
MTHCDWGYALDYVPMVMSCFALCVKNETIEGVGDTSWFSFNWKETNAVSSIPRELRLQEFRFLAVFVSEKVRKLCTSLVRVIHTVQCTNWTSVGVDVPQRW